MGASEKCSECFASKFGIYLIGNSVRIICERCATIFSELDIVPDLIPNQFFLDEKEGQIISRYQFNKSNPGVLGAKSE